MLWETVCKWPNSGNREDCVHDIVTGCGCEAIGSVLQPYPMKELLFKESLRTRAFLPSGLLKSEETFYGAKILHAIAFPSFLVLFIFLYHHGSLIYQPFHAVCSHQE